MPDLSFTGASHTRGFLEHSAAVRLSRLTMSQRFLLAATWLYLLGALWWEVVASPSIVDLGSYNLMVSDPGFVAVAIGLLATAVAVRALKLPLYILIASLFFILLLYNLVRGMFLDPVAALTWLRGDGAVAPFILMALLVPYSDKLARSLDKAILTTAALISVILVVRLLFQTDLFMVSEGLEINEGRPLAAHGAIILAMASGILLTSAQSGQRGNWGRFGALACVILVYLSGQGTATICAVLIVAIVFALGEGPGKRLRLYSSLALLVAGPLFVSVALPSYSGVNDDAFVNHRLQNVSNRQAIWDGLLQEYETRDATGKMLGVPAGYIPPVYAHMSFGFTEWRLSMHSMYIGLLSRFGAVGLSMYITLIVLALSRLIFVERDGRRHVHSRGLCIAFLAASLVFGYSYELRFEQLLLVIIPMGFIGSSRRGVLETPTSFRENIEEVAT